MASQWRDKDSDISSSTACSPAVLVTGASGYIGSRIVCDLLQATTSDGRPAYRVRAAVRGSTQSRKYDGLRQVAQRAASAAGFGGEDFKLELVSLDLSKDRGWDRALEGCRYVLHLASPFPLTAPPDAEQSVVQMAVNGTRRMIEACSRCQSLRRLVLTSSSAAVSGGGEPSRSHKPCSHVFTERDWTDPDLCPPYERSKTLAERKAWELWRSLPETCRFEMVVLNPVLVIGPMILPNPSPSVTLIWKMFSGEYPAVPNMYPAMVDVRDVSLAHRKAMTLPGISGNRYILSSEVDPVMSLPEIAQLLKDHYGPRGYWLPTIALPWWVCSPMRLVYSELKLAYPFVDTHCYYNVQKASMDLGIDFMPVARSVLDMAQTFEDLDMIRPPASILLRWLAGGAAVGGHAGGDAPGGGAGIDVVGGDGVASTECEEITGLHLDVDEGDTDAEEVIDFGSPLPRLFEYDDVRPRP